MELRHLRYFQVLPQTLNFTRAAELLHIAQPPLSRQIQQFEDELGGLLLACTSQMTYPRVSTELQRSAAYLYHEPQSQLRRPRSPHGADAGRSQI
ncbi:regulatory helix-turn-helix protein, lysR family [Pseudomonas mucidolens]|uniref:Regulatory helix-turn-helix protein, lysR family n=1 Tax=Pseudomonas mucidolens TaxID=46679 RepID=A0A1H2MW77_9PSED|nr:regulatory helix-turn-helix protein, lysR family [Pseudomonas mucidolens]SQH33101.1 transcriptional activator CatR [Pseudomonas mucidolens]